MRKTFSSVQQRVSTRIYKLTVQQLFILQ